MLERVMRIMIAVEEIPMEREGNTQCIGVSNPEGGNHPKRSEKPRINIMLSQKFGMEIPIKPVIFAATSNAEYCFVALKIPSGTPKQMAIKILIPDKRIVVGKRLMTSSNTGLPLAYDVPRFNLTRFATYRTYCAMYVSFKPSCSRSC